MDFITATALDTFLGDEKARLTTAGLTPERYTAVVAEVNDEVGGYVGHLLPFLDPRERLMFYLYDFSLFSKPHDGVLLERWTHTSYAEAVTLPAYPGVTYSPMDGLTHSSLSFNSEKVSGQLTLTVPRDFPLAVAFLQGYPYGALKVRVIEVDEGIPFNVYRGSVRSCVVGELTAELTCTNGSEALQRLGLRLNGGRQCQWSLYGPDCGVAEAPNTRTGTVLSVSADGRTVGTTLSEATGFFKAGRLKARGQARMVTASTGGTLSLFSAIPGLAVGDALEASKGCDRTTSLTTGCGSFSNIYNFSGFDKFVTPKNIFSEGAA